MARELKRRKYTDRCTSTVGSHQFSLVHDICLAGDVAEIGDAPEHFSDALKTNRKLMLLGAEHCCEQ